MEYAQINRQNKHDLLVMERIAICWSFLALDLGVRWAVTAGLPMAQPAGRCGIDGRIATRYVGHRGQTFALNLIQRWPRVGYRLHAAIVSRYRDELAVQ